MPKTNLLPIVLIILLAAGAFAYSGGQLPFAATYGGCNIKESATFALVPYYGYYSCEPNTYTPTINTVGNWIDNQGDAWNGYYSTAEIPCPYVNAITQQCEIKAKNKYSGIFTGSTFSLYYRTCDSAECGAYLKTDIAVNQQQTLATIKTGQKVQVKVYRGLLDASNYPAQIFSLTESHLAYGLFQYERGLKTLSSLVSCSVPSTVAQCVDCKVSSVSGTDSGISTITNNPVSTLLPDTFSTYLKDWLVSPIKSAIVSDTDGSQVFCSTNSLYNIGTTKTEMGCGAFPISFKRGVTCCPGDKLNQYTSCGADFAWHQQDYGCIVGGIASITACNGQGNWYSTGSLIYQKATACNSDGTCTYSTVSAPCAAPNVGCAQGAICVVDNSNPANNKCQGGVQPCGDNNKDCYDDCTYTAIPGCTPSKPCAGENEATGGAWIGKKYCCAGLIETGGVCKKPSDGSDLSLLIWLILPALGGLLLYAVKKEVVWGIIGAVVGALLAVLISWLMSNWLLALFGGTGVFILIFIVITVLAAFAAIVKTFTGKFK